MAESSVQSVERTFALLEQLAARPRGMGLVELADLVGLHKSTAHRLLSCLSSLGYVVKDSGSAGHYRLTYKLLSLSNGMLEDVDVLSAAKPHLDALSDKTGETVHLLVPEGVMGVYIYKSDPAVGQSQMRSKVGLRVPLVNTAAGKAMLAMAPEEAAGVWERSDHTPQTCHTITKLDDFMAELAAVRHRGWAIDNEENELGVRCIGAAVPDYRGRAIAAMSISANAARMTAARVAELTPLLLRCRDDICHDLGQKIS